ncbi:MAG: hypothetical protein JSU73_02075 [candidate division WOR-3 bacterium]|nr:MAG: hypothetical protein JSU73_02075 [candidate division WOR-3 bacterium]
MAKKTGKSQPSERPRNPRKAVAAMVQDLGCAEEQRDSYQAFAFELLRAMTRAPVPDFEDQAKRVVMKWFERGLSGKKMWLLGQMLIRWRFGKTANGSQQR